VNRYDQPSDGAESTERSSGASASVSPVFLTAREVADMLRVDTRTILRWAQHDASMPATRLGRVVRFEREPTTLASSRPARQAKGVGLHRPGGR